MNGIEESYNSGMLHYVGGGNVFDSLGIRRNKEDSQDGVTEDKQDGNRG